MIVFRIKSPFKRNATRSILLFKKIDKDIITFADVNVETNEYRQNVEN
jgi:hypothetical protein